MDFLVNILTALLVGQLQYVTAHSPAPSPPAPQAVCGDGPVKPVHIVPADKWVCPVPVDEPVEETTPPS